MSWLLGKFRNWGMKTFIRCVKRFPGLEVRLYRYKKCKVYYKDLNWDDCILDFSDDLSELVQHEYDHLDGIHGGENIH